MAILAASLVAGAVMAGETEMKGTIKLGGQEGGVMFANKAEVKFEKAMKAALKKVPGKMTWMALENVGGYLCHMATIVAKDRTVSVVTVDSGTGKVINVEPVDKEKAREEDKEKGKETDRKVSFNGTLRAVGEDAWEYPYQARVTLEKAIKTALKAYPGRLYEVYIYRANGCLIYGIEIALKGKDELLKVDVDAGNGKVVNTDKM